jgi:hypothetical protein
MYYFLVYDTIMKNEREMFNEETSLHICKKNGGGSIGTYTCDNNAAL